MPNKLNPLDLIKFISKSKEMNINDIVKFLLNAIERIVHSQLDPDAKLSLSIDEDENRLILINESKIVISNDEEYEKESNLIDIKLSEALLIDPTIMVGDVIASEIKFDDFSRTTFSKIEQSFKLEILNLEKSKIYNKFFPLIGEQVDAKLEEDNGRTATFILEDGTHCLMPTKFRNMNISLSDSDYHKVFIEEVYENSRDYQVLVSNSSSSRIREVLKIEVPEIDNGTIQIVAISRIPGVRAKISFRKNPDVEQNIDIIGSIIGQGGQRINSVSSKIGGEKIDVILYSDDFNEYISNAMSPSKVISINLKPNGKDYLIIVPDKHNTIAIGKQGINVKLTVELTKTNIDIISHSDAKDRNIDILWNGNVNPEQVAQIEASDGQRSFQSDRRNTRWNNNSSEGNRYNSPNLNMDEFDKELAEYKTEINEFASGEFSFGDFTPSYSDYENNNGNKKSNMNFSNIKESIQDINSKKSSPKDLKDIEKSFQFDSDLASDIDFNDYDFSDFDEDF
ncbi:MAG: transcription termination factor NusA [Mycoplasmataceae bacterium]|nr:transcription termination factor NusA [Mycoplasmataceae bacterium]